MLEQELMRLAERCEAATGADRELDAAIAYQHHGFYVRDEGQPFGRQCYDTHGIAVELPRYTASLDAAMTLVPEGYAIAEMKDGIAHDDGRYCQIRLWIPANPYCGYTRPGRGFTPALALCAAALRARAQVQS